jgi:hypothetical protein
VQARAERVCMCGSWRLLQVAKRVAVEAAGKLEAGAAASAALQARANELQVRRRLLGVGVFFLFSLS